MLKQGSKCKGYEDEWGENEEINLKNCINYKDVKYVLEYLKNKTYWLEHIKLDNNQHLYNFISVILEIYKEKNNDK